MEVASLSGWRAEHFAGFSGATLDVRIPLTQALIDGVLARDVRPRVGALRRLELTIHPGNRLHLLVASERLRWLPPLAVPLLVQQELLPGPRIRLQVLPGGVAATLASWLTDVSRGRIRGVRMQGREIEIDIAALIPQPDGDTLSMWFERGEIITESGVAWVGLRLASPPQPARPGESGSGS